MGRNAVTCAHEEAENPARHPRTERSNRTDGSEFHGRNSVNSGIRHSAAPSPRRDCDHMSVHGISLAQVDGEVQASRRLCTREAQMRMIVIATAVALLAPAAALADPPAPAVESAGVHQGEPLTCRYYYFDGHIIRRPVCKTEREWIRERLREQADVAQFQLRSLIQHP
jgi:hypothetical protein